MARLTEQEKKQMLDAARRKTERAPKAAPLLPESFIAFATAASALRPAPKPVRFTGEHWKL